MDRYTYTKRILHSIFYTKEGKYFALIIILETSQVEDFLSMILDVVMLVYFLSVKFEFFGLFYSKIMFKQTKNSWK